LPDLPSTVDDVVLWLLAKDPAERPPDLRTAVRALESAAQNAGIDIGVHSGWDASSSPSGSPLQTQPPPRRHTPTPAGAAPTIAPPAPAMTIAPTAKRSRAPLLIGVVAGVAVIGAGLFFFLGGRAEPTPKQEPVTAPVATVDPAPEPPKPEPPKPADPKPETPANVIVTITGVPDGTEVLLGGTVIGAAPGPVQLPYGATEVVLTFKADGYLTASKTVMPDKASTLEVGLKKKPGKKATGTKSTKDDIINVEFGK
jgi:hypothetical protein